MCFVSNSLGYVLLRIGEIEWHLTKFSQKWKGDVFSETPCRQRTRSSFSHHLALQCIRLSTFGKWACSVSGATVWNDLLPHVSAVTRDFQAAPQVILVRTFISDSHSLLLPLHLCAPSNNWHYLGHTENDDDDDVFDCVKAGSVTEVIDGTTSGEPVTGWDEWDVEETSRDTSTAAWWVCLLPLLHLLFCKSTGLPTLLIFKDTSWC